MSAVASCSMSQPWQGGFLSVLPTIRRQVRHSFRHLRKVDQEESVQESIAAACLSYRRLALQGRLYVISPTRLAQFAVRHTRSGRHVGGSQEAVTEPLGRRSGDTKPVVLQFGDLTLDTVTLSESFQTLQRQRRSDSPGWPTQTTCRDRRVQSGH